MAARFDACRQRQVEALEGAPPSAALAAVSLLDSLRDEVLSGPARPGPRGRRVAGRRRPRLSPCSTSARTSARTCTFVTPSLLVEKQSWKFK